LLAADHDLLGTILAGDFVIIDVLSGQVARRGELLDAISSGQLRFAEIRRHTAERSVRRRDSAAVVVGRTTMVIRYREDELTVHSRYTHLYARENHRWRLLSAQGTPITAPGTPAGRPSLFCDTALAQRIEQAEAQLITEASQAAHRRAGTAGFIISVAGGVASFAELASFENVLGRALNGEHERVTPPGLPTPQQPAVTSQSSPPPRDRSPSRTRSARASICSTPALSWSGTPEPARPALTTAPSRG
jgi:hypothetical protein